MNQNKSQDEDIVQSLWRHKAAYCFKAGPAVLDMFLLVMNERIYKEGLVKAKTPLRSMFGTSNEWSPEGCEVALGAFFDRFLFRKEVKPIRTSEGIRKLCRIPKVRGDKRGHKAHLSTSITLPELDIASKEAMSLPFTDGAEKVFFEIHQKLQTEKIEVGDRRLEQSVSACQAYAWLCGAVEVHPEHLDILRHILWVDPVEQPEKVSKIITRICNPVGEILAEVRQEADSAVANCAPKEAISKLEVLMGKLDPHMKDKRAEKTRDYLNFLHSDLQMKLASSLVSGRR